MATVEQRERRQPWILLSPAMLAVALLLLVPLVFIIVVCSFWLRTATRGLTSGQPVKLVVRAEKLRLARPGPAPDGEIAIDGTVETVDYQGQVAGYFVREGEVQLQAINMIDGHPFHAGEAACLRLRPRDCAALSGEAR